MKITIDTTNKTIKVEETVNFCELNKELKKLLGENLKDYSVLPIESVNVQFVPEYPRLAPFDHLWRPYDAPHYTGAPPIEPPYKITCSA